MGQWHIINGMRLFVPAQGFGNVTLMSTEKEPPAVDQKDPLVDDRYKAVFDKFTHAEKDLFHQQYLEMKALQKQTIQNILDGRPTIKELLETLEKEDGVKPWPKGMSLGTYFWGKPGGVLTDVEETPDMRPLGTPLGDATKVIHIQSKEERVGSLLEDPGPVQKGSGCYFCGATKWNWSSSRPPLMVRSTRTLICESCALEHLDQE